MKKKSGFTLLEMLVVIGIIVTLMGAGTFAYRGVIKRAQKTRCEELVNQVATAFSQILQKDGAWPRSLLSAPGADSGGEITADVAMVLAKKGVMSLAYEEKDDEIVRLKGVDQFGIVSPWAQEAISRAAVKGSASEMTKVSSGGTVADHRLHFSIDSDMDGYVTVNVNGSSAQVRGCVAVWCYGMNGKDDGYKTNSDDVHSWAKGQVK